MPPIIAAFICCAGIAAMFWFDRDPKARTSPALWIALTWFLLACSRTFSRWMNLHSTESISDQMLDGNPVDRAVFTGLLLLGLFVLLNRRQRVLRILQGSGPILLFFGYCLMSLMWSDFPGVGFKRWNKALGDWVMIMVVLSDPRPIAALKRLFAILTYTLIPLSILFIKYYSDIGRGYGRWLGEVHYLGVTTDKNTLGAICLLFGLASVWRVLDLLSDEQPKKERNRHLKVQYVMLAMILWMFSFIDSMTSLLCFLLASGLLFATRLRFFTRSRKLVHFVVLGMILLTASIAFLGLSPGALHAIGRNATLTERTDIWAEVVKLVPSRWVGAGYESFWLGPRLDKMVDEVTHWWVPNQSHNGYLEVYANLGWVGIGFLVFVLFWGYQTIVRAWRQHLPAADLMLAYFVTGVIYNFTEAALFRMMYPVWIFFLMAITFQQATRSNGQRGRPVRTDEFASLQRPASSMIETCETV